MSSMTRHNFILPLLLCIILFACSNSYENKIVGKYRIADYFPESFEGDSTLTLDLLEDKSFLLNSKEYNSRGKWKAGDDGDRTWLRFSFDNGNTSDAQVV